MSASPNTHLGKYQIIREIARSNDIVYEGYDPLMNRRVAIKELNIPSSSTPQQTEDRVRRFEREVKAAGSLSHPGIVTIFEVGVDAGRHFMAMEYLDGRTLRNELESVGVMEPIRALEITIEVLGALSFAHQNGVVHRDVKPENIQLLSDGRVKLTDFGIARLTFEPNITMDGQVFGTPSYMSPEQVVGKEIDARSDLFSVGSVLFEMLAGYKAFQGDNVVAISMAITSKSPDYPAHLPHVIQQILMTALDKTPAMRMSSAVQFIEQLTAALDFLRSGGVVQPQFTAPNISAFPPPPPPPAMATQYGAATPYGTPPPLNHPPYTYGSAPSPTTGYPGMHGGPLPIYLPAPKVPLFKPETIQSIQRFFVILITSGLILGLVVVSIQGLARAYDKKNQVKPPQTSAETKKLAITYEELGRAAQQAGDNVRAEENYREALRLDPANPAYASDLGFLFQIQAERASSSTDRLDLWQRCGEWYSRAANLGEKAGANTNEWRESGAIAYINASQEYQASSDNRGARNALYKARELTVTGSELDTVVMERLKELENGG